MTALPNPRAGWLTPLLLLALLTLLLAPGLPAPADHAFAQPAPGGATPTPTPSFRGGEPVVPAATRAVVTVPPRPGQPTWTPSPTATPTATPMPMESATATAVPAQVAGAAGSERGEAGLTATALPPAAAGSGMAGGGRGESNPAATAGEPGEASEPMSVTVPTPTAAPRATPAPWPPDPALASVPARFGYGVNLAVPDWTHFDRARQAGFGWVKMQLAWSDHERRPGQYEWLVAGNSPADDIARRAADAGLRLVLRVDTPPGWANGERGAHAPPDDPAAFARFLQALAARLRGRVAAYEIWNEPNLAWEWGNQDPDPAAFARLLNAAYDGVKAGDPDAFVISGALVATGWTRSGVAMDDMAFLRGMAAAGARFDALGVHPYGFAASPDGFHPNGALEFRRAEAWRAAMEAVGWADRPMWATEFNWLVDPAAEGVDCTWPDRDWQRVAPEQQAAYLVQAFAWARERWPWMGPMFVFNLDMATVPAGWSPPCEQMRWYSLWRPDGSARPAFDALRLMPKPSRP